MCERSEQTAQRITKRDALAQMAGTEAEQCPAHPVNAQKEAEHSVVHQAEEQSSQAALFALLTLGNFSSEAQNLTCGIQPIPKIGCRIGRCVDVPRAYVGG